MSPTITKADGEAALAVMRQLLNQYGTAGTEDLMKAVFDVVPEEKCADVLQSQGYVSRWHVMGSFPAGFAVPVGDADGFATVYPPEKKGDLNEAVTVAYNAQGDIRFAKKPAEQVIRCGIIYLPQGS